MEKLEEEERLREEAGFYTLPKFELDETLMEIRNLARKIRDRKLMMRQEARIVKQSSKPIVPRTAPAKARDRSVSKLRNKMEDLGVTMAGTDDVIWFFEFFFFFFFGNFVICPVYGNDTKSLQAHFTKTRGRARSRSRSAVSETTPAKRLKTDISNRSASRSQTRPPRDESGVKDLAVSLISLIRVEVIDWMISRRAENVTNVINK